MSLNLFICRYLLTRSHDENNFAQDITSLYCNHIVFYNFFSSKEKSVSVQGHVVEMGTQLVVKSHLTELATVKTVQSGLVMSVIIVLLYKELQQPQEHHHHHHQAASHQQQESLLRMATPLQCPSYK